MFGVKKLQGKKVWLGQLKPVTAKA
jgi:hypothetical protein